MNPKSYDTLSQADNALRKEGFKDRFEWSESGLKNLDNDKTYSPKELKIVGLYRFEGMSNPGDMSILHALECSDGRKGTVISSYGAYGDEKLLTFLEGVARDLPFD